MHYEDEKYVRAYTRDTTNYLMLSWDAQCLLWLILRKVDRAGVLELGSHGLRGVMAHLSKLPPERWPQYEAALHELIDTGTLVFRHNCLVWPKFIEGQECRQSDVARKRASRELRRDLKAHGHLIDDADRDRLSQNVTDGHDSGPIVPLNALSRNVTPGPETAVSRTNGHTNGHLSDNGSQNVTNCPSDTGVSPPTPGLGHSDLSLSLSEPSVLAGDRAREYRVNGNGEGGHGVSRLAAEGGEVAAAHALERSRALMLAWNAIPGASPFGNEHEFQLVAQAVDGTRRAALEARQAFPDDAEVLGAVYRVVRKMADDGLTNVWQPKVLARQVSSAVQLLRGEQTRSTGSVPSIDDLMRKGGSRGE